MTIVYVEMGTYKEERPLSFGCVVLYFGRNMMALGNMVDPETFMTVVAVAVAFFVLLLL
jgi:hypothetical protein